MLRRTDCVPGAGQPGGIIPCLRAISLNSLMLTCARFPRVKGARGSGGPPFTLKHSMMGHISVLSSSAQCSLRVG